MANFNSDDLLLKSKMLISKFRKQREASLIKQDAALRKSHHPRNISSNDQYYTSDYTNRILSDCDSYAERDCDINLLSKFNKQYFNPIPIKTQNIKIRQTSNKKNDDTVYAGNLSESDNSLWSYSTESHSPDVNQKVHAVTVERGVMTDCNRNLVDEEDVFTPVTALPSTLRTVSDRNKFPLLKEKKTIDNITNNTKKFSSICTDYEPDRMTIKPFMESQISISEAPQINGHRGKIQLIFDEKNSSNDENNKMDAALKLFQQEKILENEINKQLELVGKLDAELVQLTSRIGKEEETLNELKTHKDEIRSSRYQIFNGLSNELQSQLAADKGMFSTQSMTERSQQSNNQRIEYCPESNCVMNHSIPSEAVFALDSETVRNIVDKIILKEFSNSEDNIFSKKPNTQSDSRREDARIETVSSDEDCVLSDVLSAKDLHIDHNTMATAVTPTLSMCRGHPPRMPKLKSRSIRAAHSVENISQHRSISTVKKPNSRKIGRSMASSEHSRSRLRHRSGSHDSSSSSTDQ